MNGYELSRCFWDYTFEHPEKIRPIHSAIFFFAIEHCNRLGWKKKFGFPSQMVMEAIGVKNWRTYSRALNELVEFGFIEMIELSKNQYSSNIIAIVNNTKANTKALDKALQKHSTKQGQSTVSIDKQYNKEQLTIYSEQEFLEDWAVCRKKIKNLPTNIKRLKPEELINFTTAKEDYNREEFQRAMQGLFKQEKISFNAMILRPNHFLEDVEKYLNAFDSKDFKLYGEKPVEY